MKTHTILPGAFHFAVLTLLAATLISSPLKQSAFAADTTSTVTLRVDIHGSSQDIIIELDEKNAPKTSANFKKLAASGFYDGIAFHRVIPNYIVQAGDPLTKDSSHKDIWGTGGPGYTLQAEIGLPHERGSIAMARLGDSVNPKKASSGSQFYIALARLPKLDREYTVFGKVISGLEYLDQIAQSATDSNNNPTERIEIVASSSTGGVTPSLASNPTKLASPPAMPKGEKAATVKKETPAATSTIISDVSDSAGAEPTAKKKSWFKRKFGAKNKKEDPVMAEVDETTPAPNPAPVPTPKAEKKPAKLASNADQAASNEQPTYRNDKLADSRSAMSAAPADQDDAGISLADEMKMQTVKGDAGDELSIREDKERTLVGRFLYRYW